MHLRHVVPFLLLFAWQAAPAGDPRDAPSRVQAWLGLGTSSFDLGEVTDCNGQHMQTEDEAGTGVQVDGWPSPSVRMSGAVASKDDGTYQLGLAAWEGPVVGVGAGWAGGPDRLGYEGPAVYLRLGSVDDPHLRVEVRTPTATPGITGWARAGLAWDMGMRGRGGFFLGAAAVKECPAVPCPATVETFDGSPQGPRPATTNRIAVFGDISLGLGRVVGLFLRGHLAENSRGFGLGIALRLAH